MDKGSKQLKNFLRSKGLACNVIHALDAKVIHITAEQVKESYVYIK